MKLTDKDKADIVSARAVGMSLSEIAEKFTVSKTAISKILKSYESSKNGKNPLFFSFNMLLYY